MKIKNKTAGHAGIACFSFALKGNRAGSPHFKIVRFKWWEHVTKQGSGVLMADFDYKKRKYEGTACTGQEGKSRCLCDRCPSGSGIPASNLCHVKPILPLYDITVSETVSAGKMDTG